MFCTSAPIPLPRTTVEVPPSPDTTRTNSGSVGDASNRMKNTPPRAMVLSRIWTLSAETACGSVLLSQGDRDRALLLLLEGRGVALMRPVSVGGEVGDLQRVGRVAAPGVTGEIGFALGSPRTATVVASTRVRALVLRDVGFVRCVEENPMLAVGLLRWAAESSMLKTMNARWFSESYSVGSRLDADEQILEAEESDAWEVDNSKWSSEGSGLLDDIQARLAALR